MHHHPIIIAHTNTSTRPLTLGLWDLVDEREDAADDRALVLKATLLFSLV